MPKNIVQQVTKAHANPKNYEHEYYPACFTTLGALAVFKKGTQQTSIAYGLYCPYIIVDPTGSLSLEKIYKSGNQELFYNEAIIQAVKQYFPENQDLKMLHEEFGQE